MSGNITAVAPSGTDGTEGLVMKMSEVATVTIPIDEYFDLRSKAEANMFLMTQLGEMQNRIYEIDKRLFELEQKGR